MVESAGVMSLLHPGDRAVVVFLRPHQFLATPRTTTVFDVTEEALLVGIFSNGMKTIRVEEPGERFYMGVLGGRRSIMRATLRPGHIYYVKVFLEQVHPLRPESEREAIRRYWHESVLVAPGPLGEKWLEENRDSVDKHRAKARARWPLLTPAQQHRFDLRAELGVEEPIR